MKLRNYVGTMILAAALLPEAQSAPAAKLRVEDMQMCIGFDDDDFDQPATRGNNAIYMPCSQAPAFELNDDYHLMIVGGSQHGNCLRGYPLRSLVAMDNCDTKTSWRSLKWYPVVVLGQPNTYRFQNQFTMRYLDHSLNEELVQTDTDSPDNDSQWFKLPPSFFLLDSDEDDLVASKGGGGN